MYGPNVNNLVNLCLEFLSIYFLVKQRNIWVILNIYNDCTQFGFCFHYCLFTWLEFGKCSITQAICWLITSSIPIKLFCTQLSVDFHYNIPFYLSTTLPIFWVVDIKYIHRFRKIPLGIKKMPCIYKNLSLIINTCIVAQATSSVLWTNFST